MKLTFLLLGLAAAADSSSDSAPEQSTNDYGYEAPETQTSYAAEPTYAETYQAAPVYRAISYCFSACAPESPCFNKRTGQCAPKSCGYHSGYESYADEAYQGQEGYRRLQADDAGDAADAGDDAGYGNAAGYEGETYAAAPVAYSHEERVRVNCGCPAGFKNSHDFNVHSKVVLWIAFGLLFAPAFCFLWRGVLREFPENLFGGKGASAERRAEWDEVSFVRIGAGVVCLVASLAYLVMSLGHGYINKCDGRAFYYARYVDWMITTPIMLWDLCKISKRSDNRTTLFIVFIDFIMIASGLIGGLIGGTERWAFFGFSIACFLPIIYFLCYLDGGDNNGFCGFLTGSATDRRSTTYRRAMNLTVLSWIGYPVIWAVAEGGETLNAEGEAIAYTVLDIISKSVFGWIIVFTEWGDYVEHIKADVLHLVSGSSHL